MPKIVLKIFAFLCFAGKEKFWHYLANTVSIWPLKNNSVASWRVLQTEVSIKHGLRSTDYGLRTGYKIRTRVKDENRALRTRYKTRRKVLHWINSCMNVFINGSYMYLQLLKSLIKKIAHFPKESAHKGLTILDRLPKKKRNTLKVTKLTSCMNFRMIQAVIK